MTSRVLVLEKICIFMSIFTSVEKTARAANKIQVVGLGSQNKSNFLLE